MIEKISDTKKCTPDMAKKSDSLEKISNIAGKLFNKLDKDKNGTLSVFELNLGGISSLDTDVSKQNFVNTYMDFAEKTSTLAGCMQGFDKKLFCPDEKSFFHDVTLTDEQRKELVKRIELYTLAQPLLKEDFRETENYLLKMLKCLKENKNIQNRDISLLFWLTNPNKNVVDGKIGPFKQGQVGDCWLLSQINCYASNPDGAKNISERIKDNRNGTYTVIFQNPFNLEKQEEYHVFDKTIRSKGKKKARGEKDVQILEIAFGIYLEKYSNSSGLKNEEFINGGNSIKLHLLHKALGYKGEISTLIAKNGKTFEGFYDARKDFDGKVSLLPMYTWGKSSTFEEFIKKNKYKPENLTFSITQNNEEKILNNEKAVLKSRHAYNLTDFTNSCFIINNPHLSTFPIHLKKERFENLVTSMHYLPLDERIPYSPDKKAENNSDENAVIGYITSAGQLAVGICKMSVKWLYKTIENTF